MGVTIGRGKQEVGVASAVLRGRYEKKMQTELACRENFWQAMPTFVDHAHFKLVTTPTFQLFLVSLGDKRFETTLTWAAPAYVRNVIWELDKHRSVAESQGYRLIPVRRSGVARTLSYVRKYRTWSIIGCLRYIIIKFV